MNINNKSELVLAIEKLEARKLQQRQDLTAQYHKTIESVQPGNLVKSALGSIDAEMVLKTAASVGVALAGSKLTIFKGATGTGKKIINSIAKTLAAKTVFSNTDKIKAYGKAIIKNFRTKSTTPIGDNGIDHL